MKKYILLLLFLWGGGLALHARSFCVDSISDLPIYMRSVDVYGSIVDFYVGGDDACNLLVNILDKDLVVIGRAAIATNYITRCNTYKRGEVIEISGGMLRVAWGSTQYYRSASHSYLGDTHYDYVMYDGRVNRGYCKRPVQKNKYFKGRITEYTDWGTAKYSFKCTSGIYFGESITGVASMTCPLNYAAEKLIKVKNSGGYCFRDNRLCRASESTGIVCLDFTVIKDAAVFTAYLFDKSLHLSRVNIGVTIPGFDSVCTDRDPDCFMKLGYTDTNILFKICAIMRKINMVCGGTSLSIYKNWEKYSAYKYFKSMWGKLFLRGYFGYYGVAASINNTNVVSILFHSSVLNNSLLINANIFTMLPGGK